jgi:hypothetical protein
MSGPPGGSRILGRAILGLGIACAGLAAADLAVEKHPHFPWEGWFAFFGAFGFLSYSFIVFAGRALRRAVMRKEGYYDE